MSKEDRLRLAAACWEAEDTVPEAPPVFLWRHPDYVHSCRLCWGMGGFPACDKCPGAKCEGRDYYE